MAPAPSGINASVDYYEFLSIPPTATESEIQRAYRRTNLKYHPDKFKATAEISEAQAAEKLDQLQQILVILKDPAERAKYDQQRDAAQRRKAETGRLEAQRRKMKEALDKGEAAAAPIVNGMKRTFSETEARANNIAVQNQEARKRKALQKAQEAKEREAAEAKVRTDVAHESDPLQRSVKISWVREGEGLDIEEDTLRDMAEAFGPVENARVLKDKRRRLNGQEEKSVVGNGLVVFESLVVAKKALQGGPWHGMESVGWAFSKEGDAD